MNTKHAQYMLTVLQEGSITAAAKKLFISQPSLSQMIKLVENNLGTPIFNRSTDPISLTCAGEKYMDAAKKILAINRNLQREIDEINHEDHGTIRLGIPVQRAMEILPQVLPVFFQMRPHVSVEILEHGSATTESLVMEGAVDLACITTSPRHKELEYTLVAQEELVLLTGTGSSLSRRIPAGTPIDITEAAEERFVNIKTGHSVRATQDQLFLQRDIHPPVLLETISIEVAKRTAIACGAVMICPLNYISMSPELLSRCVVYPILGIDNPRGCYICRRKDQYLPRYMQDFISVLIQEGTPRSGL